MDLGIRDRVAVVAAASRGLGFATARQLVEEGVRVAICGRDADSLARAEAELVDLAQDKEHVLAVQADLSDPGAPLALVDQTRERFGRVDIVVPNAGGPPNGGARAVGDDPHLWQRAFDTNFWATVRLVNAALPTMIDGGWGRVVIIGSTAVKEPAPELVLSNATRSAVWSWAKTLASEVAVDGLTVNMALPGLHNTDRVAERMDADGLAKRLLTIPARRMGEPAEFASLVAYLCSDRAGFITGVAVAADGGAMRAF